MKTESDSLVSGQEARLFPVLADTSKEGRSLSILLACLSHVHEFGHTLLKTLGLRIRSRSRIEAFTEVKLPKSLDGQPNRPDGLIVVSTGKRSWTALVEAKIGRSKLEAHQIHSYMQLARENEIDAVVTISNEFAAMPSHHPLQISRPPKNVHLFHWSWASILTHAKLLLMSQEVQNPDQQFLLHEFVRFLDHPSTGVMRFDRMTGDWKNLVASVVAGSPLSKKSDIVVDAVASWHQETRDLALKLTELVSAPVSVRLSPKHRDHPNVRIQDDAEHLSKTAQLRAEYNVPDAASAITVTADLSRRSVSVSMRLPAPEDRRSTKGRVNWLLRQLAKSEAEDLHICAYWPRRSEPSQAPLEAVRSDPDILTAIPSRAPASFEVRMVRDASRRFSGAKTFVEELESTVPRFYEQVGQRLKRWQPAAPRIREDSKESSASGDPPTGIVSSNDGPTTD